ncbi:MAG: DNA gyrase inhibitor YacG [Chromatiaceae bacterium]|nr:MAG: DNA gyrase inhibitor YacG [Chromatiaceae bacterium]
MAKTVRCPTCGAPVPWTPTARYRPFCSERCRLLDLGDWFDEQHRISTPSTPEPWLDTPDSAAADADDLTANGHGRPH